MADEQFTIGNVHITRGDTWVVSRWDDGSELHAHPEGTEEEAARAESLGYKGSNAVGEMTRDHDVLHHLLAHAKGDPYGSHLLWQTANGVRLTPAEQLVAQREEAVVLLMARLMNEGLEECLP